MLFTDEHDALRAEVRRWADERLARRAAELEDPAALDALAAEVGALGYLDTGDDLVAAVVVAEELGRARAGGVAVCLLAQAHLGSPLVPGHEGVVAVAGLSGVALNAHRASAVVVVDGDRARLTTSDWTVTDVRALGWDGADIGCVDTSRAVAEDLDADIGAQRRRWWLVHAAALVAGAWRDWEEAREYGLAREAFGRPVGTFQVNRQGLAELATRLTAARELVHDLAAGGLGTPGRAATVWWFAVQAALATSDACLQLHGGYGYTMEYPAQVSWRDARMHDWGPAGLGAAREDVLAALDL